MQQGSDISPKYVNNKCVFSDVNPTRVCFFQDLSVLSLGEPVVFFLYISAAFMVQQTKFKVRLLLWDQLLTLKLFSEINSSNARNWQFWAWQHFSENRPWLWKTHSEKAARNIYIFADFLPASLHSQWDMDTKGNLTNDSVCNYKEAFSKDFQNYYYMKAPEKCVLKYLNNKLPKHYLNYQLIWYDRL